MAGRGRAEARARAGGDARPPRGGRAPGCRRVAAALARRFAGAAGTGPGARASRARRVVQTLEGPRGRRRAGSARAPPMAGRRAAVGRGRHPDDAVQGGAEAAVRARARPCARRRAIVDAGCFLGGSTAALLAGMRDRPEPWSGPPLASYDLFRVEEYTLGKFFGDDQGLRVGDSSAGASTPTSPASTSARRPRGGHHRARLGRRPDRRPVPGRPQVAGDQRRRPARLLPVARPRAQRDRPPGLRLGLDAVDPGHRRADAELARAARLDGVGLARVPAGRRGADGAPRARRRRRRRRPPARPARRRDRPRRRVGAGDAQIDRAALFLERDGEDAALAELAAVAQRYQRYGSVQAAIDDPEAGVATARLRNGGRGWPQRLAGRLAARR